MGSSAPGALTGRRDGPWGWGGNRRWQASAGRGGQLLTQRGGGREKGSEGTRDIVGRLSSGGTSCFVQFSVR